MNTAIFAWGPEGHSLVARIADSQLTPAARARVDEILGPDVTMASVSSWADDTRRTRPETAPWHFIDIPIDKPRLDMARDCPKGDCVLVKIEDFEKVLADPAVTPVARREALMFVIHFIGDMHQPLHCSDHADRGGNGVRVLFFDRPSNLHSIWDSGLLGRMQPADQLFAEYSKECAKRARKWGKGSVEDWAEQAHKASQRMVYGKLPKPQGDQPLVLDRKYEKAADPLVRQQIEKAGVRLAADLNRILK